jgi:hypothetical protein
MALMHECPYTSEFSKSSVSKGTGDASGSADRIASGQVDFIHFHGSTVGKISEHCGYCSSSGECKESQSLDPWTSDIGL